MPIKRRQQNECRAILERIELGIWVLTKWGKTLVEGLEKWKLYEMACSCPLKNNGCNLQDAKMITVFYFTFGEVRVKLHTATPNYYTFFTLPPNYKNLLIAPANVQYL